MRSIDVARHLVDRPGVDERADVDGLIEAAAEPQIPRPRFEPGEEGLDHSRLDDNPRTGGATLAGGSESRPEDAVGREVEVRVGEDDDGILAAQLEADPL